MSGVATTEAAADALAVLAGFGAGGVPADALVAAAETFGALAEAAALF